MKKLINNPDDVVRESLEGMAVAHPNLLKVHLDPHFIYRADAPVQGKVAVISGGGSGHEPMHGGFVGIGMLDAACPGEVFTSPTPDQMLEAAKMVNGNAGVLNIVKNYSGDVMNFEMAAELAHSEGIQILNILIDDDVAVKDNTYTRTVREWDADKGEWVEVELIDPPLQSGNSVLAFVNSMGGTPLSELYIVYRKLVEVCEKKNLQIVRNLIGPYIPSLEMQGCSITLLKMDDEMIKLWDAPVKTPALRWGI